MLSAGTLSTEVRGVEVELVEIPYCLPFSDKLRFVDNADIRIFKRRVVYQFAPIKFRNMVEFKHAINLICEYKNIPKVYSEPAELVLMTGRRAFVHNAPAVTHVVYDEDNELNAKWLKFTYPHITLIPRIAEGEIISFE